MSVILPWRNFWCHISIFSPNKCVKNPLENQTAKYRCQVHQVPEQWLHLNKVVQNTKEGRKARKLKTATAQIWKLKSQGFQDIMLPVGTFSVQTPKYSLLINKGNSAWSRRVPNNVVYELLNQIFLEHKLFWGSSGNRCGLLWNYVTQNLVAKKSEKFCGRIERNLYMFQVSIEFIIHKAGGLFLRTKQLFLKLALHRYSFKLGPLFSCNLWC